MCSLSHLNWATAGTVLSASLPLVISGIVTYIAWQQFAINRRHHRLALFEKRMAVVNSTMRMLASVVQTANPDLSECFKFIRETRDHEFLFGPEVAAFINEVFKKATALHAQIQVGPGGAAQQTEIMTWFLGQMGEARKLFLPYVDFRKP